MTLQENMTLQKQYDITRIYDITGIYEITKNDIKKTWHYKNMTIPKI